MQQRLTEGSEAYESAYETAYSNVSSLFTITRDLNYLAGRGIPSAFEERHLVAMRYLVTPPISADDLETLTGISSNFSRLRTSSDQWSSVVELLAGRIDKNRFPWTPTARSPEPEEKSAALLSTSTLMAMETVRTSRRSVLRVTQETSAATALRESGYQEVRRRRISSRADFPAAGEFCLETSVGSKRADIALVTRQGRAYAVECKASNSAVNSFKRLNREAISSAQSWLHEFSGQVQPAVILAGVFRPANVMAAQASDLEIYWSHDMPRFVRSLG